MKKPKTEREKQLMKELGEANNKLRWFCVVQDFECKTLMLRKDWYEKIGTYKTKEDNWIHKIKARTSKEFYTISDFDYLKIINTFTDKNIHLI